MQKQSLTPAETRVVRLVSLGCTTRQVAKLLSVTESTADNHRSRAMKKLGVSTVAALTRAAIASGITSMDDRLTDEEQAGRAVAKGELIPWTRDDGSTSFSGQGQ